MLQSLSSVTIPVRVGGIPVEAVVDSAAQVTIISDRIFNKLKNPPKKIHTVSLQTAGRQMYMHGFIADPLGVNIGQSYYKGPIYVAPIQQDMLFGMDLIQRCGAIINVGKGTFIYDGHEITMNIGDREGKPSVARVTVAKRCVVPPKSVVRLGCQMDKNLSDYYVEPCEDQKVFGARTACKAGEKPVMCIINTSDRFRTLKKGQDIGRAYPIPEVVDHDDHVPGASSVQVEDEDSVGDQRKTLPDHLHQMFDSSTKQLDEDQQGKLAKLLTSYQDVFASSEFDLGNFNEIEHSIDTGTARPIKQRMRRTPACFAAEEESHLQKMLDAGVIQESVSEWAAAPVLIRKADGNVRYCIDYRALNKVTVKDVFPLPLIDDCLDTLSGNVWFSKLDANSAYWQVRIDPEDRKKTAFQTKYGLYEHVKMGFGLCNAPATYARVMNLVLRGLNWKTVLAFLDDILVMGKTFEEHLSNLEDVLKRFRLHGLKLKPKKCQFFQTEVEFLGRIVDGNSLSMSKTDIQTVLDWPIPKCSKDVEKFMGLANYHRNFVKNFSELSIPLYGIVGKKKFVWGEEQQKAFDALREALTNPPVLALARREGEFILDTDASDRAIGAELSQIQDGEPRVIAYGSYTLTSEQQHYCTTRKELLAIVRFTRQFRHYLLGRPFMVRTDHSSLTWLVNFKEPQGQLARWLEELSQYNMILKYRAGKLHGNSDALSRIPDPGPCCNAYRAHVALADLPCGGCKYCTRVEKQWGTFICDVDDAVPLKAQGEILVYPSSEPGSQGTGAHLRVPGDTSTQSGIAAIRDCQGMHCMSGTMQGITEQGVSSEVQPLFNNQTCGEGEEDGQGTSHGSAKLDAAEVRQVSPGSKLADGEIPWDPGEPPEVWVEVTITDNTAEARVCGVTVQGRSLPYIKTCWGYDCEEVRQAQDEDPDLKLVLEWKKGATAPSENELFSSSKAAKAYWLNKEQFVLIDGILDRQRDDETEKDLVVPRTLRNEVLRINHDIPAADHQGIARTRAQDPYDTL